MDNNNIGDDGTFNIVNVLLKLEFQKLEIINLSYNN